MSSLRERAVIPVLLFVGGVISIISSLGAPLIPTMARTFHTSLSSTQWALTATLLVAAVASPLVGRLGDGRHRRTVIVTCLAMVVLGCAIAALAQVLWVLVFGRALQGLGMALMPLTMAAARDFLPPKAAVRAIAALSVIGAAGVGLGYPITGLIAEHFDIHAAYWFGTILTGSALVAAILVVPRSKPSKKHQRIDYAGAGLIGIGLLALLLAFEKGPEWGWSGGKTLGLLAGSIVVLILWTVWELRAEAPLVDLRLVRHRAVLAANVTGLTLGVTMYMVIVIITQFVQLPVIGFGESVFVAGLTLVPMSVLSTGGSRMLPFLERTIGLRAVIPVGCAAISVSALLFALLSTHLWAMFVVMGGIGIGIGATFAAMPSLIVAAVPAGETSSAMGFYQVSRFIGFSLGSGLCITLLRAFGDHGVPTTNSYRLTAVVVIAMGIVTAIIAWVVPGRTTSTAAAMEAEVQRESVEDGLLASAGLEMLEDNVVATGGDLVSSESDLG